MSNKPDIFDEADRVYEVLTNHPVFTFTKPDGGSVSSIKVEMIDRKNLIRILWTNDDPPICVQYNMSRSLFESSSADQVIAYLKSLDTDQKYDEECGVKLPVSHQYDALGRAKPV